MNGIYWQRTDLSMDPPSIQMADTDVRALEIDAGEVITGATCEIVLLSEPGTPLAGIAEVTSVLVDSAIVTVEGLTRDTTYELSVIFERSDGTEWTKTLVIRCVA